MSLVGYGYVARFVKRRSFNVTGYVTLTDRRFFLHTKPKINTIPVLNNILFSFQRDFFVLLNGFV